MLTSSVTNSELKVLITKWQGGLCTLYFVPGPSFAQPWRLVTSCSLALGVMWLSTWNHDSRLTTITLFYPFRFSLFTLQYDTLPSLWKLHPIDMSLHISNNLIYHIFSSDLFNIAHFNYHLDLSWTLTLLSKTSLDSDHDILLFSLFFQYSIAALNPSSSIVGTWWKLVDPQRTAACATVSGSALPTQAR